MLMGPRRASRLAGLIGVSILLLSAGPPPAHAAPFTLTVTLAGAGAGQVRGLGIECPSDCTESYEQGTSVVLHAYPGGGSQFAGWTWGGCSTDVSCPVTVTADTNVTATFDEACSYDLATRELSIKAEVTYVESPEGFLNPFEVKELAVGEGHIMYERQPCAGATTVNTDVIRMFGTIPAYIILDLGETGFAPGATPEASGDSEIELFFDVKRAHDGGNTSIRLMTTDAPEVITLGEQGWNLNGDDDADVVTEGVGSVVVSSEGGADVVSGQGGRGTGPPSALRLDISGGDGPDRLVGTDLQNDLIGGDGPDVIIGHRGNDWLSGTKGRDVLRAGGGRDRLFGGGGPDTLNGGQGVDECHGARGRDITRSCENVADRV